MFKSFLSKRVCMTLGATALCFSTVSAQVQLSKEVDLGGLLPASPGDLAGLRPSIQAAFDFGQQWFNEKKGMQVPWTLAISRANRLAPTADNLLMLKNRNITLIAGPLSSENFLTLAPNATANGQLLASYGSTSPAPEFRMIDHFFRILPDDSNQVPRIADQMISDGITSVVIVYRNDQWGDALNTEFRNKWTQLHKFMTGSRVNSVPYSKDLSRNDNFGSVADSLESQVREEILQSGTSKVAVFAVGFEEIAALMEASAPRLSLDTVKWYGIDTHNVILTNKVSGKFADQVEYTISQVAPNTEHEAYLPFRAHLNEAGVTGEVSSYAYAAFDTVMLLGLAAEHANSTNAASVAAALPIVAKKYNGLLGKGKLNKYGDRESGSYEFKQVINGSFIDLLKLSSSANTLAFSYGSLLTLVSGGFVMFLHY